MSTKTSTLVLVTFATTLCFSYISAFPTGAPAFICKALKPQHLGAPLKQADTPSPYTLHADTLTPSPGAPVTVSISASDEGYKGFLCAASRLHDARHAPLGSMATPPGDAPPSLKTVDCMGAGKASGVTHASRELKQRASFSWSPPQDAVVGDAFKLRCVVVQSIERCWNDFQLNITITDAPTPPARPPPPQNATSSDDGVADAGAGVNAFQNDASTPPNSATAVSQVSSTSAPTTTETVTSTLPTTTQSSPSITTSQATTPDLSGTGRVTEDVLESELFGLQDVTLPSLLGFATADLQDESNFPIVTESSTQAPSPSTISPLPVRSTPQPSTPTQSGNNQNSRISGSPGNAMGLTRRQRVRDNNSGNVEANKNLITTVRTPSTPTLIRENVQNRFNDDFSPADAFSFARPSLPFRPRRTSTAAPMTTTTSTTTTTTTTTSRPPVPVPVAGASSPSEAFSFARPSMPFQPVASSRPRTPPRSQPIRPTQSSLSRPTSNFETLDVESRMLLLSALLFPDLLRNAILADLGLDSRNMIDQSSLPLGNGQLPMMISSGNQFDQGVPAQNGDFFTRNNVISAQPPVFQDAPVLVNSQNIPIFQRRRVVQNNQNPFENAAVGHNNNLGQGSVTPDAGQFAFQSRRSQLQRLVGRSSRVRAPTVNNDRF